MRLRFHGKCIVRYFDSCNLCISGPFTGLQFPGEVPNRDAGNSPASSDSWTIKGAQAPVAKQPNKKKYQPQKSVGKPTKTQQKPRIRNYNVKDETQAR